VTTTSMNGPDHKRCRLFRALESLRTPEGCSAAKRPPRAEIAVAAMMCCWLKGYYESRTKQIPVTITDDPAQEN
jgi:hypothetical protein